MLRPSQPVADDAGEAAESKLGGPTPEVSKVTASAESVMSSTTTPATTTQIE